MSNIEEISINIIIADADPQSPIFVEIETDAGQSICIGEELRTNEGLRKLRVSIKDTVQHEKL